jgi:hypothetical protein
MVSSVSKPWRTKIMVTSPLLRSGPKVRFFGGDVRHRRPMQGGAVDALDPAHQRLVAELVLRPPSARLPEPPGVSGISQQLAQSSRERLWVAGFDPEPLFIVPELIWDVPNGAPSSGSIRRSIR